MGPRADFACLSKKCQQDGSATVYPDLPISSTRCPVCGSKRLQRLYNSVNVAMGKAKAVDAIVEPAYTAAHEEKNKAEEAQRQRRVAPPLAVPIVNGVIRMDGSFAARQFPQLQTLQTTAMPGGSRPLPQAPTVVGQKIQRRPPRPAMGSMRDREFRIGRDSKGFTVEKA